MKFQHDLKSYEHLIHEHSEEDCDTSIDFSYDGSVVLVPLIDYNSLISRLEEAEEEVSSLQQALQTKSKAINKLREKVDEADEVEDIAYYTTKSWLKEAYKKKKQYGDELDAMILADSLRGMPLVDIVNKKYTYNEGKSTKKCSRNKIYRAVSVRQDEDLNRIVALYREFRDYFSGISLEQILDWRQKKLDKGSADKWTPKKYLGGDTYES